VVGIAVFNVPMRGSFLFFAFATLVYMVGTVGIGLLFSTIANSMQVATLLVWLTTMLPSFMLSGFVFPIDSMPKALQYISLVVPARYYLDITRGVFLKGTGINVLWPQLSVLAAFGVFFFAVSSMRFRRQVSR
jgi:ABC-2 type transport system permease protein